MTPDFLANITSLFDAATILPAAIGLLVIGLVLMPFFWGKGGELQDGAAVNSPEQLAEQKVALVQAYAEEEAAYQAGAMTEREWKARQAYILSRYIDAARRCDYLEFVRKAGLTIGLVLTTLIGPFDGFGQTAYAQTDPTNEKAPGAFMGERHLMMLRPGLEMVWGTSVFAVVNEQPTPMRGRFAVMIPKETSDFAPQEGVDASELKQDEHGGLFVEKDFAPGTTVVGIGFMVPAAGGRATLTVVGPASDATTPGAQAGRNIGLLVTRGAMQLALNTSATTAANKVALIPAGANSILPGMGDGESGYHQYVSTQPLIAGEALAIQLRGIPIGRAPYWTLGVLIGLIVFLGGGTLAWKRRLA